MKRVDHRVLVLPLVLAVTLLVAPPVSAQLEPLAFDQGASGLGIALRRVGVSGRVLFVTAHPDDEHNGVLVRLARGLGVRTALLSLTRGEGGQNAIGPELFEALGVLRTEELMATHRYDGVEQLFGRPYEFGYSFSVDETFAKWGREETLGDIVRVMRAFRPDVVLTLPLEGPGGGQHHQAVAQLARDAFRAAADPVRFPDQVRDGLRPWPARKLYQGGAGGSPMDLPGTPVSVPTGVFDPLLGMTWQELGSIARSLHRCQGMGQLKADPGDARGVYFLVDSEPAVEGAETTLLDGLDTTLVGLAHFAPTSGALRSSLADLQGRATTARAAFDPHSLETAARPLAEALGALRALLRRLPDEVVDPGARFEIEGRLRDEERDLEQALVLAQGLVVEARADDGLVTPGQTFGVTLSLWNHGAGTLDLETAALEVPSGWTAERAEGGPGTLEPRGEVRLRFGVRAAPDARPSQPYWRRRSDLDRFDLDVPAHETLPWSPPAVVARLRCRVAGADDDAHDPRGLPLRRPLRRRREAARRAGRSRSSRCASPRSGPPYLSRGRPGRSRSVPSCGTTPAGRVTPPSGWRGPQGGPSSPVETQLHFAYEGEEVAARFRVTPPERPTPGTAVLRCRRRSRGTGLPRHRAGPWPTTTPSVDNGSTPPRCGSWSWTCRSSPDAVGGLRDGVRRRGRRRHPAARRSPHAAHRRGSGLRRPLAVSRRSSPASVPTRAGATCAPCILG